ncbi:M48 family metallopeptidase [Palleronia sp. LCG004]|uniref:M48 family metallopeptidase n=1 Tax=Palleronia sp. LCG004 TaxID=3079304 RepID=UPI0029424A6B|nr:M48 family metallopeptidase [Palleronia sp. LCG004]WOI55484.1 M48 family metallopeptidase [Palleronia sp. LCG004]
MCQICFSRRSFLTLAGAGAVAGCDRPPDLVSDEQVEKMGLEAWQDIRANTEVSANRDYQGALDQVAARLLAAQNVDSEGWEILVFASPQVNAFALPGGKIGVYEGMFEVFANEDQLAAIVGHEIGHLGAEHAQARMSAQVAKNAGMRVVAWLLNMGDVQYAAEIAAALGLGVEVGLLLPYSRDQELEADRLGLETMQMARYDPREAVELWQRMQRAQGNRGPEFLATHPTPDSRIRQIEGILQTL